MVFKGKRRGESTLSVGYLTSYMQFIWKAWPESQEHIFSTQRWTHTNKILGKKNNFISAVHLKNHSRRNQVKMAFLLFGILDLMKNIWFAQQSMLACAISLNPGMHSQRSPYIWEQKGAWGKSHKISCWHRALERLQKWGVYMLLLHKYSLKVGEHDNVTSWATCRELFSFCHNS